MESWNKVNNGNRKNCQWWHKKGRHSHQRTLQHVCLRQPVKWIMSSWRMGFYMACQYRLHIQHHVTTENILSQYLSTEDMKYIQPINSKTFGRNSLPLFSLFYHFFLQDRLVGMIAITERYFHSQILASVTSVGLTVHKCLLGSYINCPKVFCFMTSHSGYVFGVP